MRSLTLWPDSAFEYGKLPLSEHILNTLDHPDRVQTLFSDRPKTKELFRRGVIPLTCSRAHVA